MFVDVVIYLYMFVLSALVFATGVPCLSASGLFMSLTLSVILEANMFIFATTRGRKNFAFSYAWCCIITTLTCLADLYLLISFAFAYYTCATAECNSDLIYFYSFNTCGQDCDPALPMIMIGIMVTRLLLAGTYLAIVMLFRRERHPRKISQQ
jgi:hypothetical protein